MLAFPLGFLGLHRFYLRQPGIGILYLLTFGIIGIGYLVDLLRIRTMVRNALPECDNLSDEEVLKFI